MNDELTIPRPPLTLGNGSQVDFFSDDSDAVPDRAWQGLEQRGEFTGERLRVQNPRLYQAIVKLVAMELPVRAVAEVLMVSVNTVQAVREHEKISVETEKERIGKRWRFVQELGVEGLIEDFTDPERRRRISARDKAIIAGIAAEKSELLLGGATARIDSMARPSGPTHDDYLRSISNVTPVPATGLGGENAALKEAGEGEPGAVAGQPEPTERAGAVAALPGAVAGELDAAGGQAETAERAAAVPLPGPQDGPAERDGTGPEKASS